MPARTSGRVKGLGAIFYLGPVVVVPEDLDSAIVVCFEDNNGLRKCSR